MPAPAHYMTSDMSTNVIAFAPDEPIVFDPEALSAYCAKHGATAEDKIANLLFQIEERLLLVAWQIETDELRGLRRSAEMLASMATMIGMVTLERAATSVELCLINRDARNLPACAARLARLSEYGKLGKWSVIDGGVA